MRIAVALALCLVLAAGAWAYDWEYLAMAGVQSTCIEADPIHDRVFVGTVEGFHYLEQSSGDWTNRDWDDWIGRQVWSIRWHDTLDQRVITGRENAFFKGYLEYSDDLGASEVYVYGSQGGGVSALEALDGSYFACTWPDIAPGEFLRSDDGGESWTLRVGHGHYAMTALEASPDGGLFLGGDNRVTLSRDLGLTWDQIGGDLPGLLVNDLAFTHPGGDIVQEVQILAANEAGLYYSEVPGLWEHILEGGVRRVVSFPGPAFWPPLSYYVAVVTLDGRVLVSSHVGGNWSDETGDLPGTPIDLAYSPSDDAIYVVTAASGVHRFADVVTAAPETPAVPPLALAAFPNPFNPSTRIALSLPAAGEAELSIFDVSGRRVATLLDGPAAAGQLEIVWRPDGLPSGIYLARLRHAAGERGLRLVLLK